MEKSAQRDVKFKSCKTDAVIIMLTDVSAMLPSSGYTRLNTVVICKVISKVKLLSF